MKIYTKKGDKGDTQLLGGSIVKKNHVKLECYGTIDELNALIGNIYDQEINPTYKKNLLTIQNQLFNLGSRIAFDGKKESMSVPNVTQENITNLEQQIDKFDNVLPPLTNFILPCGLNTASKCHIARTVCRRAERNLVALGEKENIDPVHLKYLNRLSDYLFVLARVLLMENNIPTIEWEKD